MIKNNIRIDNILQYVTITMVLPKVVGG